MVMIARFFLLLGFAIIASELRGNPIAMEDLDPFSSLSSVAIGFALLLESIVVAWVIRLKIARRALFVFVWVLMNLFSFSIFRVMCFFIIGAHELDLIIILLILAELLVMFTEALFLFVASRKDRRIFLESPTFRECLKASVAGNLVSIIAYIPMMINSDALAAFNA
ncbi:MAG: hypothetical protein ACOYXC_16420 [Candidatus Rifleibacteriota bacterium]